MLHNMHSIQPLYRPTTVNTRSLSWRSENCSISGLRMCVDHNNIILDSSGVLCTPQLAHSEMGHAFQPVSINQMLCVLFVVAVLNIELGSILGWFQWDIFFSLQCSGWYCSNYIPQQSLVRKAITERNRRDSIHSGTTFWQWPPGSCSRFMLVVDNRFYDTMTMSISHIRLQSQGRVRVSMCNCYDAISIA